MTNTQINSLVNAILRISQGGIDGPTGFESLTMAIGGEGMPGNNNVASSLSDIAQSIDNIASANAIQNIASAIVYLADTLERVSNEKVRKQT